MLVGIQAIFDEVTAFTFSCFADYPMLRLDEACTVRSRPRTESG